MDGEGTRGRGGVGPGPAQQPRFLCKGTESDHKASVAGAALGAGIQAEQAWGTVWFLSPEGVASKPEVDESLLCLSNWGKAGGQEEQGHAGLGGRRREGEAEGHTGRTEG